MRPLQRKLKQLDAWAVGLRRGQAESREDVKKVEIDEKNGGIYKLSPLADWSEQQIEEYVRRNDVPKHRLFDEGYTSIGCAPCTRPNFDGENVRAGRWWWEEEGDKECGIHFNADGTVARKLGRESAGAAPQGRGVNFISRRRRGSLGRAARYLVACIVTRRNISK